MKIIVHNGMDLVHVAAAGRAFSCSVMNYGAITGGESEKKKKLRVLISNNDTTPGEN